jgi:hypothetical protein
MPFIVIPAVPSAPPALTKEQAQSKLSFMVRDTINRDLSVIFSTFKAVYDAIWTNKDGLTPQECFDALGTDAVEMVMVSNAIQTAVNSVVPNSMDFSVPATWTMTPNQDGTVTVTQAS